MIERADRFAERRHRQHVQTIDQGRFAGVRAGQQHPGQAVAPRRCGDRQNPSRRMDRTIQRQLAEHHEIRDFTTFDDALCGKDAERDRQVKGSAGLADVCRRQVYGDAMWGKLESGVSDGAPNAVAAFAHTGIREADHRENRHAERHVHFDVDGTRLDAVQGGRSQRCEHVPDPAKRASGHGTRVFKALSMMSERRRQIFQSTRRRTWKFTGVDRSSWRAPYKS
jgi:hypothetical protein